jgi:hypothetical protein
VPQSFTPAFPPGLLPATLSPFIGLFLDRHYPEWHGVGGMAGLGLLLTIVFLHPLLSHQPRTPLDIPVCEWHHQRRRNWLVGSATMVGIGLLATLLIWLRFSGHRIPWEWVSGPACFISVGALALWFRLQLVGLEPGRDGQIELLGSSPAFRDSLPRTWN